ncbi:MAG TPA: chemoreceptor glutamine deamidase CheD [Xanthobacteraceae bacterium]|nr:chemoreceptor glutamine deamidase CheD [Xanthobacteraceae bacterium]
MTADSATLRRPSVSGGAGGDVTEKGFYDPVTASWTIKVLPGRFYITPRADEVIVTVLGSCVSACIRDAQTGVGGMNHFMLASDAAGQWGSDSQSTRYGNFAMEKLINELIKAGCPRERMEIKVFGGGNVTDTRNQIGTQNAEFVLRYLEDEGLSCTARDLGGPYPRRIQYFPATGRVVRKLLTGGDRELIVREESEYAKQLAGTKAIAGEVQLFGMKKKPAGDVQLFGAKRK